MDLHDPGAFILLGEVGRAIREIQGEERGGEALQRFGAFVFHAFHFHAAGEPIYLLERETARHLVGDSFEVGAVDPRPPDDAGYLQLPRNLFFSAPEESQHAEAVDGIFWTRSSGDTLSLLVAMGVREGRPGLSLTELPPVPIRVAKAWLSQPVRADGRDFASALPGGELGGLHSLATLGEVLKLVARSFAYLGSGDDILGPEEIAPHPREISERRGPTPSRLPFHRVTLRKSSTTGEERFEEGA